MGKVLKIAGITASVIIGAGFATGNEIKKYFTQYGAWGYGIMALCAAVLFLGCVKLTGSGIRPGKAVLMPYVFFTYVLMLAALGDLVQKNTILPAWTGIAAGTAAAVLGVLAGFGRFTKISGILSPVIALSLTAILLFTVKCPFASETHVYSNAAAAGPGTAVIFYCGYNFLSAVTILPDIGAECGQKQKILGCGLGLAGVFLCILVINNAFLHVSDIAEASDMPLIALIFSKGTECQNAVALSLLSLVFLLSLCSSAVSFARMAAADKNERRTGLLLTASGILPAFLGFGTLMDKVYPAFGCAGCLLLALYLTGYFKKIILYRKNKFRSDYGRSSINNQKA